MEILCLWRRRSLTLFTTCRLSLSERACSMRNSIVSTPMAGTLLRYVLRDLLEHERLENVAGLDVAEVHQRNTALHAVLHFADIVLEAPQAFDLARMHHHVVAQHAHTRPARYHAIEYIAAGDDAHLGDLEDVPHFGAALVGFLEDRVEHAGHGLLDLTRDFVNDRVQADVDALLLAHLRCVAFRPHVEADHNRLGG